MSNTTDQVAKRLEQLRRDRQNWIDSVDGGTFPTDKEQPLTDSITTARAARITQLVLDHFLCRKGFEYWWSDCGPNDREEMLKAITHRIKKELV